MSGETRPRGQLLGRRPSVSHRPEGALGHRLGAVDGFERQHGHLKVRREHEQVEQLRHPGPREPQPPSDRGPVGTESPVDSPLEVVRQGEPPGHVRQPGDGPKVGLEEP